MHTSGCLCVVQVGDRVLVSGSRTGVLRFVGSVKFAPGYVGTVYMYYVLGHFMCNTSIMFIAHVHVHMCRYV